MERVSRGPSFFFFLSPSYWFELFRVPLSHLFPPLALSSTPDSNDPTARETHDEKLDAKSYRLHRLHSLASPLRYTYIQCPSADAADSCSLITSPVCCGVALAGCIIPIIFVHRTDCYAKFRFCYVSLLFICTLLLTVNVCGAKLLFVTNKIYIFVMFNNFSFVISMHHTKIHKLLVNIGSVACRSFMATL